MKITKKRLRQIIREVLTRGQQKKMLSESPAIDTLVDKYSKFKKSQTRKQFDRDEVQSDLLSAIEAIGTPEEHKRVRSVAFNSLPWAWVKQFMGTDERLWQLRKQWEAEAEAVDHDEMLSRPEAGWIELYKAFLDMGEKFWAKELREDLKKGELEDGSWVITGETYMDDVHMQSATLNPDGTFTWKDWVDIAYDGGEEEVREVVEGLSAQEIAERVKRDY